MSVGTGPHGDGIGPLGTVSGETPMSWGVGTATELNRVSKRTSEDVGETQDVHAPVMNHWAKAMERTTKAFIMKCWGVEMN